MPSRRVVIAFQVDHGEVSRDKWAGGSRGAWHPATGPGVPYGGRVPTSHDSLPRLTLTRRGRQVRSLVVLVAAILVIVLIVALVRALSGAGGTGGTTAATDGGASTAVAGPAVASDGTASDGTAPAPTETSASAAPAATPSDEGLVGGDGITHTGVVGDGTWSVAAPVGAEVQAGTVHTYALRVENGISIDAGDAATQVERILADERGWRSVEDVAFRQVSAPEEAEFTISVASPPTVDSLCAPARTGGTWSCRIGDDVVLNSDRWTTMTPTYTDIDEYRAYMVNHEVGHFLGHGHETCGGAGLAAPVMLQQSMDLGGCRANAWPTADGAA